MEYCFSKHKRIKIPVGTHMEYKKIITLSNNKNLKKLKTRNKPRGKKLSHAPLPIWLAAWP